ncbi:hypothetical protein FM106_10205 [Brachybacterium faecium]|nr:hypothetical protein FM106_10205 [Brachybacterium faecium]
MPPRGGDGPRTEYAAPGGWPGAARRSSGEEYVEVPGM